MAFRPRFTCSALLLAVLCTACGGGGKGGGAPGPATQSTDLLQACPALAPAASAPGSLGAAIDALVAAEMAARRIPAMTVTLARKGEIVYARAYGYADLARCRPAAPGDAFQIGSVTKQFTAAAILQLQDAGQLDIDHKVQRYLPGYAVDPRLTLRMLLNQTSGLPDYAQFAAASGWVKGVPQAVVLDAIVKAPALFAPGTAYAYSNSNYFMLAAVIEAVGKTSYADYLSRHIFQPLGLQHTAYAAPLEAQTALPYTSTRPLVAGTQGLAAGIIPDPSLFFGASALWSTGADLATWNAALLGGAVVSPALLATALTPPAAVPVFQNGAATSYAMGWIRGSVEGHPLAWHNGKTYAYTAFNGILPDNGYSLSILANVDVQEETPLFALAQGLAQAICKAPGTTC